MTIKDIRDSGLLELFVLGESSADERRTVLAALEKYPELKRDIQEIEFSLQKYAQLHSVKPREGLKQEILDHIADTTGTSSKSTSDTSASKPVQTRRSFLGPFLTSLLLALGSIAAFLVTKNKLDTVNTNYEQDKIVCDSIQQAEQQRSQLFVGISDPNSKILEGNATEDYQQTAVYIHHNATDRKNYLQIQGLPHIRPDQSYQLWSLKDGSDPIPLDVFQGDLSLFEVQFVENTNAYAITIEALGGVQSPTLERLIGVIPVS